VGSARPAWRSSPPAGCSTGFLIGLFDRFPDGVRLAELAALDAASVTAEVSTLMGVTAGSGDPVALLIEQLGERRMLLMLDNCEHVVAAVAALAHRVVGSCPNVRLLCTSREPLGLAAEVTFPVRPLAPATDAVRLFADRAAGADPDFTLEHPDVVADLCRRLDGMPLAIELAAP
jgi:predicted ATPase